MADLHLPIAPQTDVRLWNGLLADLIRRGAVDRTYIAAKQNVSGDPGTPGTQEGDWFPGPHVVGIVYMAPPRLFGLRIGREF